MDSEAAADEAELVRRLRKGDREAFAEVVRRWHPSMLRVAATFVQARGDAEDVVQETWLGVVRGIDAFEERSSLRTWIFSILVNRARSHAVREARRATSGPVPDGDDETASWFVGRPGRGRWREPVPPWQDDPQLSLDSAETMAAMMALIADLPPARRQVLVLRDVEGWSAADVSELLGISDANQRVLLHRARTTLRQRLGEERGR